MATRTAISTTSQPGHQQGLFSYADLLALVCASIILIAFLFIPWASDSQEGTVKTAVNLLNDSRSYINGLSLVLVSTIGMLVSALAGVVDIYDRRTTSRALRSFRVLGFFYYIIFLLTQLGRVQVGWGVVIAFLAMLGLGLHKSLPRPQLQSPQPLPRRILTSLYLQPNVTLALMLSLPLLWLGVVYLGSLAALLTQSFFSLDGFTGLIKREFTLRTYQDLFTQANMDIVLRTFLMAAAVTVTCALIAFPLAYYMARYASYRVRGLLYLGVMLPLWSSYLVRVYSWKLILAQEGVFTWIVERLGLTWLLNGLLSVPGIGGSSLSFSFLGLFIVFVYIWLPYMVLPINAALERVPKSLTEASSDLGARPGYTFRKIILPLAFPGVIAGSIFTFSLTLGDYIIPGVFGNSSFFIGQAVLSHQGSAGNIPLAAAFTVVPIVIMAVYLTAAKRLGAFDAL